MSASGGQPEQLSVLDSERGERAHAWPEVLPGGEVVLFTVETTNQNFDIAALSLNTREHRVVIRGGSHPRYSPTGHIVYGAEGSVMAIPFDLGRLETRGNPVPLDENVMMKLFEGGVNFDVARNGTLAYVPEPVAAERSLVWVNRQGEEEVLTESSRLDGLQLTGGLRLSPNGQKVALVARVGSRNRQVLIHDMVQDTLSQLTFDGGTTPVWTPDGERVAFSSGRDGQLHVWWKAVDNTDEAERFSTGPYDTRPSSWSGDGTALMVTVVQAETSAAVASISMEGEREPEVLIREPFTQSYPALSPDGRWVAYQSNELGQYEIYVRPFPNVSDGKWVLSREGGVSPVWAPDGTELFYRDPVDGAMMVVPIDTDSTFDHGNPARLFDGGRLLNLLRVDRAFDISPDGERFLMIREDGMADTAMDSSRINVVLNWRQELLERVPIN